MAELFFKGRAHKYMLHSGIVNCLDLEYPCSIIWYYETAFLNTSKSSRDAGIIVGQDGPTGAKGQRGGQMERPCGFTNVFYKKQTLWLQPECFLTFLQIQP